MKKHVLFFLGVMLASIVALVGLQSAFSELSRFPDSSDQTGAAEVNGQPSSSKASEREKPSEPKSDGQASGLLPSFTCSGTISSECGTPSDMPVFKVNAAAHTKLLRSVATSTYDGKVWSIAKDVEHRWYRGEELNQSISGFSSVSQDRIIVTPLIEFSPGFIPTSLYPTRVSLDSALRYYPSEFSFKISS